MLRVASSSVNSPSCCSCQGQVMLTLPMKTGHVLLTLSKNALKCQKCKSYLQSLKFKHISKTKISTYMYTCRLFTIITQAPDVIYFSRNKNKYPLTNNTHLV